MDKAMKVLTDLRAHTASSYYKEVDEAIAQLQAVTEERDRLRDVIERYADHDQDCEIRHGIYGKEPCSCGFQQTLKGEQDESNQ